TGVTSTTKPPRRGCSKLHVSSRTSNPPSAISLMRSYVYQTHPSIAHNPVQRPQSHLFPSIKRPTALQTITLYHFKPAMSTADLKHEDLLAFDHAAAGHAGVLSDSSGSLGIKPCTAQDIAFYESAAAHPEFQELMPAFMGTLQPQGTDEDPGHNRDQLIVLENLTHG